MVLFIFSCNNRKTNLQLDVESTIKIEFPSDIEILYNDKKQQSFFEFRYKEEEERTITNSIRRHKYFYSYKYGDDNSFRELSKDDSLALISTRQDTLTYIPKGFWFTFDSGYVFRRDSYEGKGCFGKIDTVTNIGTFRVKYEN